MNQCVHFTQYKIIFGTIFCLWRSFFAKTLAPNRRLPKIILYQVLFATPHFKIAACLPNLSTWKQNKNNSKAPQLLLTIMKTLMNCYQHNQASTFVCMNKECVHRLACQNCLTTQHLGHVDSQMVPIKKFSDRILLEFQRSEVDRLRRVLYKEDLVSHIQKEFQYLQEKTIQIMKQRESRLIEFLDRQYVHSHHLKNLIEHIDLMREGKIYEEGLKTLLPMLQQGVQDTIAKFEKDKMRIVTRVKEQVNQVKTVLDGLFFIGNQYQLDQHTARVKLSMPEEELKSSEDRLFQSAVLTSRPKEQNLKYPYGSYQEFVDGLYPQSQIDYVQLYNNYPVQQFQYQQPFERTENFILYGVIEHQSPVISTSRLRNGCIMTCSKLLSIFDYPSLKLLQQTAYNQNVKQVVELSSNLIALLNDNSVFLYERKDKRWVPKGEFITPGVGKMTRLHVQGELLCILIETQLIIYRLRQQLSVDNPVEFLVVSQTPNIFMHKYDCLALAFIDNDTKFYSADSGGRLYKWKTNNVYSTECVIQAANTEIAGVVPLHDGRVITIERCGMLKLWDQQLYSTVSVLKHRHPITACIPFTRDLDTFFTGDTAGKIQKWKVTVLIEAVFELDAHTDQINHLSFNQYLISSSNDQKAKLWQV